LVSGSFRHLYKGSERTCFFSSDLIFGLKKKKTFFIKTYYTGSVMFDEPA